MRGRALIVPGSIVAGLAVVLTAAGIALRPWHDRVGATDQDVTGPLPGDDLIAEPRYQTTRGMVIKSPPATIWSWLIQIGSGRGGFYSFDRLEKMAGIDIQNIDRIVPELQHLALGDVVPLSPSGGPTVVALEPGKTLVLRYVMDPFSASPVDRTQPGTRRWFDWTWTFHLRPVDEATTRLIVRTRADFAPRLLVMPFVAVLVAPAHFIMEWRMLQGIKRRAESAKNPQVGRSIP